MKTTIVLIISVIKEKVVISFILFGVISFSWFKKKSWDYSHEKWRICVNLEWWLAAVANEYASTSSVFRAILSFIHENELLHPITALYYAWGRLTAENSNLMKELRTVSSFQRSWPQQYLIWQYVEHAWESCFCAERHDGFNNTHCVDHSSYPDRSKHVSRICEYI